MVFFDPHVLADTLLVGCEVLDWRLAQRYRVRDQFPIEFVEEFFERHSLRTPRLGDALMSHRAGHGFDATAVFEGEARHGGELGRR
jgi:hypothetical protein